MGENLVAGILKNIETLASINANQNISILTGIKKTNTLLSDQIGKELSKQSKLLSEISTTLTRTFFTNLRANDLAKKGIENQISGGGKKIKAPKVEKKGKSPLFGDSINKELAKQTSLLESMVSILLKGLKQKGKKEGKSKGFGGKSVLAVFAGMAKMLKKGAAKKLSAFAKALQGLTKSIKGFVKAINKIKTKKLVAFMKILDIGKKILLFAFFFALAGPLLIVGLLVTLPILLLIFLFFDLVSRNDKGIKSGIRTLMFMAISIGILALVIAFTLAKMGGGMEMLKAYGFIALSILVLAGGLYLVGKIKGDIIGGSLAMLVASIAILVLAVAVMIFSKAKVKIEDVGLLGLTIAIVGVAMAIAGAGPVPVMIALGAAAMILAGVSILIIATAMAIWTAAKVGIDDVGVLSATILAIGVSYAAAGFGSPLIALGAAVMLLVAPSLILITGALLVFSKSKWDESKNVLLKSTLKGIVTTFKEIFSSISITDAVSMLRGAELLGEIGSALSELATGLSDFANGKAPIFKDGKVVGYKPFDKELGKRVGDTIQAMLGPLVGMQKDNKTFKAKESILGALGAGAGNFFAGPIGKGIDLLGDLGNSLSGFAAGIGSFANLNIVKFETDANGVITTKDTGNKINPQQIGLSIKALLTPLVGNLTEGGDGSNTILGKLGAGAGLFTDGPIGSGISLLGDLGNALSDFAGGVQAWADFKIPIFGDEKNPTKVTGYNTLNPDFATKIGENLKKMIGALVDPITTLGKQDGGFWSNSDYENGVDLLGDLGSPLADLAKAAETFGKAKFKAEDIKTNLNGTIGAFVAVLAGAEMKKIKDDDIDKAEDVIDLFSDFTSAAEKLGKAGGAEGMGKMFIDMKESINTINLSKLTKLNSLAENLAKFADSMDGNFDDLEAVLEKLKDAIAEMNEGGAKIAETGKSKDTTAAPVASEGGTPMDLAPILEELEEITTVLRGGIDVTATNNSFFG